MTLKQLLHLASIALFFIALPALAPERAACGGFYLIDGVGLQGRLEIGRPAPRNAREIRGQRGWYRLDRIPLLFRKTPDNRIAVIRCDGYCLTNRSVAVGSSIREVFLSYGTPIEEKTLEGKRFLTYGGTGFLLDAKGAVEAIFIFPKALE